jgi:hypothetical protein
LAIALPVCSELDQIQAHLFAWMTYRIVADVLAQMFPVGAGNNAETLRCHTLNIGEGLRDQNIAKPKTAAPAIAINLDLAFIRSCEKASDIWKSGLAMSKRKLADGRCSALSPKPTPTSRC